MRRILPVAAGIAAACALGLAPAGSALANGVSETTPTTAGTVTPPGVPPTPTTTASSTTNSPNIGPVSCTYTSKGDPLWIRSGPSKRDRTVGSIPHGKSFTGLASSGGWIQVVDNSYPSGYVNASYASGCGL